MTDPDARRIDIAENLRQGPARIAQACQAAGRSAEEVSLIAVTKFFPVGDAVHLAELGVTDLGENRDQEASAKATAFAELSRLPVRWHFIGQLQTNKARSVAGY